MQLTTDNIVLFKSMFATQSLFPKVHDTPVRNIIPFLVRLTCNSVTVFVLIPDSEINSNARMHRSLHAHD